MADYYQHLRNIIDTGQKYIRVIPAWDMEWQPAPGKWSKKEILGHLIDSAYNNHQRFIRAPSQHDLVFNGYNQDEWVKRNRYQQRPVKEILRTWEIVNNHLAQLLAGISRHHLHQPSRKHNFHQICMRPLPEEATTSLAYLVWDYLEHLEHHLSQIAPAYVKSNRPFIKA